MDNYIDYLPNLPQIDVGEDVKSLHHLVTD